MEFPVSNVPVDESLNVEAEGPGAAVACCFPVVVYLDMNVTTGGSHLEHVAVCVAVGVGHPISIPIRIASPTVDRIVGVTAILRRQALKPDTTNLNKGRNGLTASTGDRARWRYRALVGDTPTGRTSLVAAPRQGL